MLTSHLFALENSARKRAHTDGSTVAEILVSTVGLGVATSEIVTLHHAREAATFAGAGDVGQGMQAARTQRDALPSCDGPHRGWQPSSRCPQELVGAPMARGARWEGLDAT